MKIIYTVAKSKRNIITTLTTDLLRFVLLHIRSIRGREITAIKKDMPKGINMGRAYLIKINDMTKRATILAPIYNIFRYFSIKFPLILLFLLNIDFCAVI